jgi:hypothetical protein
VCAQSAPPERTCIYDLKRPGSQALAFDYDHSGKLDHLVFYRPGAGTIAILKNLEGAFVPVYEGRGIGGYDLKSASDRVLAFDYEHSGRSDHLLLSIFCCPSFAVHLLLYRPELDLRRF